MPHEETNIQTSVLAILRPSLNGCFDAGLVTSATLYEHQGNPAAAILSGSAICKIGS